MIQMNVNFEAIEKAWGKPKKTVLEELEEWLEEYLKEYDNEVYNIYPAWRSKLDFCEQVLNKIQELKKENENG